MRLWCYGKILLACAIATAGDVLRQHQPLGDERVRCPSSPPHGAVVRAP